MDFWAAHGILGGLGLCLICVLFPRLTLAAMTLVWGMFDVTLLGFIGWIFIPRIMIAFTATSLYWHTNPVLCVLAWLCIGCSGGAYKYHNRNNRR